MEWLGRTRSRRCTRVRLLASALSLSVLLCCGSESRTFRTTKISSSEGRTNSVGMFVLSARTSSDLSGFSKTSRTRFAQCFNRPAIAQTNRDDFYTGTTGSNTVHLLRGQDVAFSDAGGDRLCGGKGDDTLNGGTEFDRVDGGRGFDTCSAEVMRRCERKIVEVTHGVR